MHGHVCCLINVVSNVALLCVLSNKLHATNDMLQVLLDMQYTNA